MLRCALLLSFSTIRSVVGQPGAWPRRLGATIGSVAVEVSTARQRCDEVVAGSCHWCEAEVFTSSLAANGTFVPVAAPATWKLLPVPNSEKRNFALTVSATPLALRRMRANAQLRPWTPEPLRGFSFVGWSFALNGPGAFERRFQTSLVVKK